MDNDSVRTESKLLLGKLSGAVKVRAPQVQKVADYIEKTRKERGISAIVCGDFNDTPISFSHKKLSENLTDCYVASGNGPGFPIIGPVCLCVSTTSSAPKNGSRMPPRSTIK